MRPIASLPLLLLFAACSSAPPATEPAVEEAQHDRKMQEEDSKRRDFRAVLVRLDQAMDSYVQAVSRRGELRADTQAERLYKLINETVLDRGAYRADEPRPRPGETLALLTARATDARNPDEQGIALAALGFSAQLDVMPTILQGAQLDDPYVVDRAVLGLAVLKSPKTPPGVLEAIVLKAKHPEDGRVQAAWALLCIQQVVEKPEAIVAIWQRLLTEHRDTMPAGVLVTAVRGLGFTRDKAHADLVASFLKHPTPRVRMAAALAIGRMKAQAYWEQVLALIDPQEVNQNVRLYAVKALVELAGGVDHQYDVAAWRRTFERGPH
jgi:hypothetical protein